MGRGSVMGDQEGCIEYVQGEYVVPDRPVIPFVEGDGTGPEIWQATRRVLDAAVEGAYGKDRSIQWREVLAGAKAQALRSEWLPEETIKDIRRYRVAIKGPLTTPVGGGFRSLNVVLRQVLDLYACIRPVHWIPGVPSPVRHPERVDMVVFRENTEDVYAGIEWPAGSPQARRLIDLLSTEFGVQVRSDAGIGVKPISAHGTKRLVRMAIQYAVRHGRRSVTLMHKGNIMKYTEGAFRDWGYQVAREEFPSCTVTEEEAGQRFPDGPPAGTVIIKDRIADNMFQQILTRPEEYDVIACPNLNGDYISDALAATVGGLGMAPGANVGDGYAVFEATHGTAPRYAGLDKVNPGSLILSGAMMLDFIGWGEAARLVERGLREAIRQRVVTYDLARQLPGAREVGTSGLADAVIGYMRDAG